MRTNARPAGLQARSAHAGAFGSGLGVLTRAAALTSLSLVLVFNGADASARDARQPASSATALASVPLDALEAAFWHCDYVATTRGPIGDLTNCVVVYDALKERKFGGDFDQLVAWWNRDKVVQHALHAQAEAAALRTARR